MARRAIGRSVRRPARRSARSSLLLLLAFSTSFGSLGRLPRGGAFHIICVIPSPWAASSIRTLARLAPLAADALSGVIRSAIFCRKGFATTARGGIPLVLPKQLLLNVKVADLPKALIVTLLAILSDAFPVSLHRPLKDMALL